LSDFTHEWFNWLELDEKWLSKLTESLKTIEIDGRLHSMSWEEQIAYLVSSWIEKITIFNEFGISDNQAAKNLEDKKSLCWAEKVTMLPVKKLQYLIVILVMSGTPASIEELTEILSFRDKSFFGRNYLKPLEAVGFIKKTNSEKPKAPKQKYLLTETGKRFLTENSE
jgi:DNA-binding HxlR family transcriptional regulator